MKNVIYLTLVFTFLKSFTLNVAAEPEARVVRLLQCPDLTDWQFSVNSSKSIITLSGSELTNRLSRLGLHQGDLILLGSLPSTNVSVDIWDWMRVQCGAKKVAVYLYAAFTPHRTTSVFDFPVYHWTTPYDRPRDLSSAIFFREGEILGVGTNGFQGMLRSISDTRPSKIFILGGLYNIYSSYGPGERPYEQLQNSLDEVLKKTSTESIVLNPEYGF